MLRCAKIKNKLHNPKEKTRISLLSFVEICIFARHTLSLPFYYT